MAAMEKRSTAAHTQTYSNRWIDRWVGALLKAASLQQTLH